MEITPNVRVTRFEQVDPGDLLIVLDDTGSYVALAVKDPRATGRLALPLGPASPKVPEVLVLTGCPSDTPVVSFSKDYKLQLPCDTRGWVADKFPHDRPGLVLAEDKLCIRVGYRYAGQMVQCYIDIKEGLLLVTSGQLTPPSGEYAYAVAWSFLTTEKNPREILSFPLV